MGEGKEGGVDMVTKRCCHCKEIKDVGEFYTDPCNITGYKSRCKICLKMYMKQHYRNKKRRWKYKRKRSRMPKGKIKKILRAMRICRTTIWNTIRKG